MSYNRGFRVFTIFLYCNEYSQKLCALIELPPYKEILAMGPMVMFNGL